MSLLSKIGFTLIISLSFLNFAQAGRASRSKRVDCSNLLNTLNLEILTLDSLQKTPAARMIAVRIIVPDIKELTTNEAEALDAISKRAPVHQVTVLNSAIVLPGVRSIELVGRAKDLVGLLSNTEQQINTLNTLKPVTRGSGEKQLIIFNEKNEGSDWAFRVKDYGDTKKLNQALAERGFKDIPGYMESHAGVVGSQPAIFVYIKNGFQIPEFRIDFIRGVRIHYIIGSVNSEEMSAKLKLLEDATDIGLKRSLLARLKYSSATDRLKFKIVVQGSSFKIRMRAFLSGIRLVESSHLFNGSIEAIVFSGSRDSIVNYLLKLNAANSNKNSIIVMDGDE